MNILRSRKRKVKQIIAYVKTNNLPSIIFFGKLNFRPAKKLFIAGIKSLKYVYNYS